MVSFTDENGAETTYTYTASGLREGKTTADGVQTFYVWDGGDMVLEYEVTDSYHQVGSYKTYYVYGADGLAYRKDLDGAVYTYNTNYRGDILSVMDAGRNIIAEYQYDAYGNLVESFTASGFSDNFGYRGEYHDPESGYIYLRMRYLDPTTGRFLTEDPVRDGLNWFSYCGGNPVKYVDPWGTYFKFRNDEEYQYFQKLAYAIYGSDDLIFEYKGRELTKIEGGGENGSETGMALLNWFIESPMKYNINFNANSEKEGSSGDRSIDVGLLMEKGKDNFVPASDTEIQARLIHEAAHVYTSRMGYDGNLGNAVLGVDNGELRAKVVKDYKEAAAITVENKFREEMGYAPRDVSIYNGIGTDQNSYGTWPWQAAQKYGKQAFSGGMNITLMQSVWIWYDIQLNYMEGNFR